MLLTGLAVFTGASLLSALAPDAAALVAARAAQGAGAALLSPAALSIITTTYSGARRAAALSAWGAIAAGGFVAGLLVGGALTTWLGWRWIFFVNLPIGAAAVILVPLLVPGGRAGGRRPAVPLPAARAATLTAGLASIVYGVGAPHGWASAPTVTALAVGAVLLAGFVTLDRRAAQSLLPPLTARARSLSLGAGLMLGVTGLLAGTLFVTTFVLQQQLHASALRTGLDYLPFGVAIGLAAHTGPMLLTRFGSRVVATAALLAVAAGALLLAVAPEHAGYAAGLLPAFLILGAGTGLALISASITAMADIAAEHAGAASGLLTTGHEMGGAIGVAVFSAIATSAGAGARPGLRIPAGHHVAFAVAAAIAAGLAVLAAVALPAVRPPAGGHAGLH